MNRVKHWIAVGLICVFLASSLLGCTDGFLLARVSSALSRRWGAKSLGREPMNRSFTITSLRPSKVLL